MRADGGDAREEQGALKRLAGTAAALLLAFCASPGVAGVGAETSIEINSSGHNCGPDCTADVRVTVTSEKKKCVGDRKVRFYALYADDKLKLDADRTHDDGLAMGFGAVPGPPDGYLVKVKAANAGETKCGPAKLAAP